MWSHHCTALGNYINTEDGCPCHWCGTAPPEGNTKLPLNPPVPRMPQIDRPHRWSDDKLSEFHAEFVIHAKMEEKRFEAFMQAFPNGDPAAHRAVHDAMLEAAQEQTRFLREIKLDFAKKSLWGILMLLCGLLAAGLMIKTGLKL